MKFRELFGECLVYPFVGIFYFLIYLDKIESFIKVSYYQIFGIKYVMVSGKFGKYPIRIMSND